jgi:metal-sulfur cluster biosynthetic enzyme
MMMFDRARFIAIWKATRAGARACVHCRGGAIPCRHPGERTALARQVEDLGAVLWVLFFLIPVGRAEAGQAKDPGCASQPAACSGVVPAIAGGSDAATAVTPQQVTRALREVFDPELGMSIVELGLVYGIEVRGGAVTVTMTLTAPGCPIHDAMAQWVKEAVTRIPGVEHADVTITFDPPWTPDRIAP